MVPALKKIAEIVAISTLLFPAIANASPTMVECARNSEDQFLQHSLLFLEIDLSSKYDNSLLTHYFEISPINREKPNEEWKESWDYYREDAWVLDKEIATFLLRGSWAENKEIIDLLPTNIDTGEELIQEISRAMQAVGSDKVATVNILNRATLSYTTYGFSNYVEVREIKNHSCALFDPQRFPERSEELRNHYSELVAQHNSQVVRDEPEEGRGLPNKL